MENLAAEEDRPLQVGDVVMTWLGEGEVIYVGEGENVPLVCDCEDRRVCVADLGYDAPSSTKEEVKVTEKDSEGPRKDKGQETDRKEEEETCSGKDDSERKDEEQQKQMATDVEGQDGENGAEEGKEDAAPAAAPPPPPPVTSSQGPVRAMSVLKQRLLCVVGVVLAVVLVLAALDPYLEDLED